MVTKPATVAVRSESEERIVETGQTSPGTVASTVDADAGADFESEACSRSETLSQNHSEYVREGEHLGAGIATPPRPDWGTGSEDQVANDMEPATGQTSEDNTAHYPTTEPPQHDLAENDTEWMTELASDDRDFRLSPSIMISLMSKLSPADRTAFLPQVRATRIADDDPRFNRSQSVRSSTSRTFVQSFGPMRVTGEGHTVGTIFY